METHFIEKIIGLSLEAFSRSYWPSICQLCAVPLTNRQTLVLNHHHIIPRFHNILSELSEVKLRELCD